MTELELDLLPAAVADLTRVIGQEAALALVERYGGWRLYVPAQLGDEHDLITLIGREAAERLVQHFATDTLWLPRCTVAKRATRDEEIRRRLAAGERADDLGREYGMTVRHIARISAQRRSG